MAYAVIKTGGKQYRVSPGEKLKIEQLPSSIEEKIIFDQVLMIGSENQVQIGAPYLINVTVSATVVGQGRHKKIKIFKMQRRKHYQKHQGHRQNYTEIQINDINLN